MYDANMNTPDPLNYPLDFTFGNAFAPSTIPMSGKKLFLSDLDNDPKVIKCLDGETIEQNYYGGLFDEFLNEENKKKAFNV